MTASNNYYNGTVYALYVDSSTSPANAVWQIYADGKWVPYSTPLVPRHGYTYVALSITSLQVCHKCGAVRDKLYKESLIREARGIAVGKEPGLCEECYTRFEDWQKTQHGLEPLLTCNKKRGEQKLLCTGDLKLV